MASFILIFLCLGAGLLLRRAALLNAQMIHGLNRFVVYVALPAVTLLQIHTLQISSDFWVPVSMAWLQFALGILFFLVLKRFLNLQAATFGALLLTSSLGNTSFVGVPLLEALYGTSALATGILTDQPGTFCVLGTVGVVAASIISQGRPSFSHVLKRIFCFPPFLALLLALFLRPFALPLPLTGVLEKLSATLIPVALVAVGAQLSISSEIFRRKRSLLMIGLIFKLILVPFTMYAFYDLICGQRNQMTEITIIESAMAPMITAAIVAEEYGFDAEIANLMVGIGIPASLLTVPLLWWFLHRSVD